MTAVAAQSLLAGGVLLAVMVASVAGLPLGRRVAGRSAVASASARARFGRSLVSALDSVRTVKLAASTPSVHAHLSEVDGGRVEAAVREHRVQALLDGVPIVMVQCGVVAAWAVLVAGGWGLATALLVTSAVNGFDWFGRVAGSVITEAPGTRAWMRATSRLAGGGDLMRAAGGGRPRARFGPASRARTPRGAAHPGAGRRHRGARRRHPRSHRRRPDDRRRGAGAPAGPGRLGQVQPALGAGRAGVQHGRDPVERRAGRRPADVPAARPGRPRRPGAEGALGHLRRQRPAGPPRPCGAAGPGDRRLVPDVEAAGGPDALVGHRGVRLSGGQVQRLALARALACDAELLLADDVSSALDSATEIELWTALRRARRHRHRRDVQARGAGPGRPGRRAGGGSRRRRGGVVGAARAAGATSPASARSAAGALTGSCADPGARTGAAHEAASRVSRGPRPARPAGSPR